MRHVFISGLVSLVFALPVQAQDEEAPSLMERGAQQFLEDLLNEMEPAFDSMRDFMEEMGPAMREVIEDVKDWSAYEPPEVLENGDIIIRKKPESPQDKEPLTPDDEPMPQIEL